MPHHLRPATACSTSWCALAAALLLLTPTSPLYGDDLSIDFSGTWQLNEELSDDPAEVRSSRRGGSRGGGSVGIGGGRGGGGRGGAGRGRGGSGGGRGGGPDGADRGAMRERLQAQQEAVATLTIEHQEPQVLIRNAHGEEEILYTDERVFERLGRGGRPYEVSGQWKRDSLRLETVQSNYGPGQDDEAEAEVQDQANSWIRRGADNSRRGGEVTETWKLSKTSDQLVITTKTKGNGSRPGFELKRIYDRVVESPAPSEDSTDEPSPLRGTDVPVEDPEGGDSDSASPQPSTSSIR